MLSLAPKLEFFSSLGASVPRCSGGVKVAAMALICSLAPLSSFAQQRPLVTEDPETIGAGRMLVEAGVDYMRDVEYPASGLTGHLRRFPLIGISLGIGDVGEVQMDGGWEALEEITRDPALKRVPVVVVSVEEERERAIDLGAVDYLVKPIDRDRLLALLERHARTLAPGPPAEG